MSALLGLSYRPKSQVFLLFRILEISTFSCVKPKKLVPLWGEPLQIGHYWELTPSSESSANKSINRILTNNSLGSSKSL